MYDSIDCSFDFTAELAVLVGNWDLLVPLVAQCVLQSSFVSNALTCAFVLFPIVQYSTESNYVYCAVCLQVLPNGISGAQRRLPPTDCVERSELETAVQVR